MNTRKQRRAATPRPGRPAPAASPAPGPGGTQDTRAPRQVPARPGRPGPLPRDEEIPRAQAAIVGANIRALRHRHGLTQTQLGALMGWPTVTTVCAAEGRRGGRQRGFTNSEVTQLATIFGTTPGQLLSRCANCEGHPPTGYACLTCGAQAIAESTA